MSLIQPKKYDRAQRKRILKHVLEHAPRHIEVGFALYVRGIPTEAIAIRMKIPKDTVEKWRRDNKWDESRKEAIALRQKNIGERYADFQEAHLDEVLERQHLATTLIDTKAIEQLSTQAKIAPKKLSELARTIASSADVSSRLIGLNTLSETKKKPLLVQVAVGVRLDTSDSPQQVTINASSSESPDPDTGFVPGTEPF